MHDGGLGSRCRPSQLGALLTQDTNLGGCIFKIYGRWQVQKHIAVPIIDVGVSNRLYIAPVGWCRVCHYSYSALRSFLILIPLLVASLIHQLHLSTYTRLEGAVTKPAASCPFFLDPWLIRVNWFSRRNHVPHPLSTPPCWLGSSLCTTPTTSIAFLVGSLFTTILLSPRSKEKKQSTFP